MVPSQTVIKFTTNQPNLYHEAQGLKITTTGTVPKEKIKRARRRGEIGQCIFLGFGVAISMGPCFVYIIAICLDFDSIIALPITRKFSRIVKKKKNHENIPRAGRNPLEGPLSRVHLNRSSSLCKNK